MFSQKPLWRGADILRILPAAVLIMALAGSGCGGGGVSGSSSPSPSPSPTPTVAKTVAPHFTVQWPARSRAYAATPSALSAVVTLSGAGANGTDATFTADRDITQVGGYTQTYTWPSAIREGAYPMSVVFYALADGAGSVVSTGATTATLDATGALPDLPLQQAIVQVIVAGGQTVPVGQSITLSLAAYAPLAAPVSVTDGSIVLSIPSGSQYLTNVGGGATLLGVKPGTASVVATIDGVASAPMTVTVTSSATVTITPTNPPSLSLGGTAAFAAAVTNAPDTSVTWSVLEGSGGGGTITSAGVYTAPGTAGTYHIVATSNYDPTKSASVPVTVANGSVTVGANFPPSGSVSGSVN